MLNLDFYSPQEQTFYSIVESQRQKLYAGTSTSTLVGGFIFNVSPDTVFHERSVYTVLDWLGDVGGLFDALKLISSVIVALCTNGIFPSYVISKLFYKQQSKRDAPKPDVANAVE